MIRNIILLGACMACSLFTSAQVSLKPGKWHAELRRNDGRAIPFEMELQYLQGNLACFIVNGKERIKTENPVITRDSAVIRMPLFESYFKVKLVNPGNLSGVWIQGAEGNDVVMPFVAYAGGSRFPASAGGNARPVSGKWRMEFTRPNQTKRHALGEFVQIGTALSGSVLTPAADYRYLDGVVSGDSLFLSTFDGSHALFLAARINADHLAGKFYSSNNQPEPWIAVKDATAALTPAVTGVKTGSNGKLDFAFMDLDGNTVSLQSDRYKGKVVIVQIMGSWCSNCMDETAFLSDYYARNKDRGVEVVALAYELSTDVERSKKTLRKFQTRFNVQYAMLVTGVSAGDPQRTEKTLPQLTSLTAFPTTIILNRKGIVSDVHTSFYGPGAGEYHVKFKNDFEKSVNTLLSQKR